jgi:hypothetical protein
MAGESNAARFLCALGKAIEESSSSSELEERIGKATEFCSVTPSEVIDANEEITGAARTKLDEDVPLAMAGVYKRLKKIYDELYTEPEAFDLAAIRNDIRGIMAYISAGGQHG